jgi:hypothetical protein
MLVLSAILLFLPSSWATAIGMAEGFQKYRFFGLLCFIGACVWLMSFPIENGYRSIERKKHLHDLPPDQKQVLVHFIAGRKTSQAFSRSNLAIARDLAKFHILAESDTSDGGHPFFTMDKKTFAYLNEHPELVGLPKPQESSGQ